MVVHCFPESSIYRGDGCQKQEVKRRGTIYSKEITDYETGYKKI